MIRQLDLEGGPKRLGGWRAARLPLALLVTIGVLGGLVGGTLTSRSARAADGPSMKVDLTASSPEVAGSGGRVIYTYAISNTAGEGSIELIELQDDLLGELDGAGTCSLPQTIAAGATYSCIVAIDLVDRAGSTITTTVVAAAFAEDGAELIERSTATVTATEHARLIISHSGAVRSAGEALDDDEQLLGTGTGVDLGDGGLFGGGQFGGSGDADNNGDDLLLGDSAEPDPAEPGDTQELGYSTDLVEAPRPIECDGQQWLAAGGVHMGAFRTAELSVDTGLSLAPGRWSVEEIILHDADIDRPFYPQADERLRIEFWRDELLVAATASTSDLIDGHVSAWSSGGLGSVELPNGADRVLLVHSNVFDGTSGTNSFEPRSLCLTPAPVAPPPNNLGDSLLDPPHDEVIDESDLELGGDAGSNQVDFVIVIENVGDVPVFGLTITDAVVDELTCDGDADSVDAGQTLTCTGTYAASPDEVLFGSIQSTIKVDTLQTLPRTASTRVALPAIG